MNPRPNQPATEKAFGLVAWLEKTRVILPLKRVGVRFHVQGDLIQVQMDQVFNQANPLPVNCTYKFPLPEGAAVYRCELHLRDRVIKAVVEEQEEARALARQKRAEGHRVGIVEQERENFFTLGLGNLAPGDVVVVRFAYFQLLSRLTDWASFTVPLSFGVRYIPGKPLLRSNTGDGAVDDTDQVPNASRITPPSIDQFHPDAAELIVEGIVEHPQSGLQDISSPSHPVLVWDGLDQSTVKLAEGDAVPDHDFVLRWTEPPPTQIAVEGWVQEQGEHSYALVRVRVPEFDAAAESFDGGNDIYFLVDRSGSMQGRKWTRAIAALQAFVSNLEASARVWITFFATDTLDFAESLKSPEQLGSDPVFGNLAKSVQIGGGTEMVPAIQHTLTKIEALSANRPATIILITDGQVGNENTVISLLKSHPTVRLHAVGVDNSINDALLNGLARQQGGKSCLLSPNDDVRGTVARLSDFLRPPALTDLTVSEGWESAEPMSAIYPAQTRTFPLRAKVPMPPLKLTAQAANGLPTSFMVPVRESSADAADLLWAKQRISRLLDDGATDQAIALAKRSNLICKGTAFVAWDEAERLTLTRPLLEIRQPFVIPGGHLQPEFGMLRDRAPNYPTAMVFADHWPAQVSQRQIASTMRALTQAIRDGHHEIYVDVVSQKDRVRFPRVWVRFCKRKLEKETDKEQTEFMQFIYNAERPPKEHERILVRHGTSGCLKGELGFQDGLEPNFHQVLQDIAFCLREIALEDPAEHGDPNAPRSLFKYLGREYDLKVSISSTSKRERFHVALLPHLTFEELSNANTEMRVANPERLTLLSEAAWALEQLKWTQKANSGDNDYHSALTVAEEIKTQLDRLTQKYLFTFLRPCMILRKLIEGAASPSLVQLRDCLVELTDMLHDRHQSAGQDDGFDEEMRTLADWVERCPVTGDHRKHLLRVALKPDHGRAESFWMRKRYLPEAVTDGAAGVALRALLSPHALILGWEHQRIRSMRGGAGLWFPGFDYAAGGLPEEVEKDKKPLDVAALTGFLDQIPLTVYDGLNEVVADEWPADTHPTGRTAVLKIANLTLSKGLSDVLIEQIHGRVRICCKVSEAQSCHIPVTEDLKEHRDALFTCLKGLAQRDALDGECSQMTRRMFLYNGGAYDLKVSIDTGREGERARLLILDHRPFDDLPDPAGDRRLWDNERLSILVNTTWVMVDWTSTPVASDESCDQQGHKVSTHEIKGLIERLLDKYIFGFLRPAWVLGEAIQKASVRGPQYLQDSLGTLVEQLHSKNDRIGLCDSFNREMHRFEQWLTGVGIETVDCDRLLGYLRNPKGFWQKVNHGRNRLHAAAETGSLDRAPRAVLTGANLELRDLNGKSPILLASEHGHLDQLPEDVWKDIRADVDLRLRDTWLHVAAERGYLQQIPDTVLARAGLDFAAEYGCLDRLPAELLKVERLQQINEEGKTALHRAASNGNLVQLPENLLTRDALTITDKLGITVLEAAYYGGHLDQIPETLRLDLMPRPPEEWIHGLFKRLRSQITMIMAVGTLLQILPEKNAEKRPRLAEKLLSKEVLGLTSDLRQFCDRLMYVVKLDEPDRASTTKTIVSAEREPKAPLPVTLSATDMANFKELLSKARGDFSDYMSGVVAEAELVRARPEMAGRMATQLVGRAERMGEWLKWFMEGLHGFIGIDVKFGCTPASTEETGQANGSSKEES